MIALKGGQKIKLSITISNKKKVPRAKPQEIKFIIMFLPKKLQLEIFPSTKKWLFSIIPQLFNSFSKLLADRWLGEQLLYSKKTVYINDSKMWNFNIRPKNGQKQISSVIQ